MNTPKRNHKTPKKSWSKDYCVWRHDIETSRWKRKNRIRQLKHTIAILTERLKDTEKALKWTQDRTKCYFVRPSHWHPQGTDGKQYTRKQWMQEMKARQARSSIS